MPRSPRSACARISARQAPSCARSIASSCCATGISVLRRDLLVQQRLGHAAGTVAQPLALARAAKRRTPGRRRRAPPAVRCPAGQRAGMRRGRAQHLLDVDPDDPGRSARLSRLIDRISCPAGASTSSRRWISWRSEARACSSGRRLQSSSARRERSTGRGDESTTMASSARVLRPGGSTLSLLIVQASICPISRSRTATVSVMRPERAGLDGRLGANHHDRHYRGLNEWFTQAEYDIVHDCARTCLPRTQAV